MNKSPIYSLLFFLISTSLCAQNTNMSSDSLKILDSIVFLKNDAVELTIELSISSSCPKVFFGFFENVFTDPYCAIMYENGIDSVSNCGLTCIVKDETDYIDMGPSHFSFCSCEDFEDEMKYRDSRWFVNKSNLSIEHKWIENEDERRDYDLAVLSVLSKDTVLKVYPMIVSRNNQLAPGKYSLYLLYWQNNDKYSRIYEKYCSPGQTVFQGMLKSNVITLVVEDCPVRWWEFWKKKGKCGQ